MLLTSDLPAWGLRLAAFAFGALWGSFFNVAIHRWPRGESVVRPPSHCPACGAPIPAWRNLPIVGWLALRGKAACCGAPISARYPLVEAVGAVLCVAVVERSVVAAPGAPLGDALIEAALYFAFVGGLVIATFVDLEHMEIPDEVSLPGAALGLATVTLRSDLDAADAALGAGAGYLVVQLGFVYAYEVLTGRRGMGEGDAKLLLFIGAFVGWQGALFSLVAGAVQGLVVAVPVTIAGDRAAPVPDPSPALPADAAAADARAPHPAEAGPTPARDADEGLDDFGDPPPEHVGHLKVPFGPFLALGAVEYLFFGPAILEWYWGLFA